MKIAVKILFMDENGIITESFVDRSRIGYASDGELSGLSFSQDERNAELFELGPNQKLINAVVSYVTGMIRAGEIVTREESTAVGMELVPVPTLTKADLDRREQSIRMIHLDHERKADSEAAGRTHDAIMVNAQKKAA